MYEAKLGFQYVYKPGLCLGLCVYRKQHYDLDIIIKQSVSTRVVVTLCKP
jgi:hypothetical protein